MNLGFEAATPGRVALAVSAALLIFVLQRFGLFAVAASMVFYMTFRFFPITADPGAWYADVTVLAVLLVVVPAACGFYLSLAGQQILRPDLLENRVSSDSSF